MRIVIALNKNGCEIVSKEYKVNDTLIALDKFDKYLKKNNIEYSTVIVKM